MRVLEVGRGGEHARALVAGGTKRRLAMSFVGRPELDLARPKTIAAALLLVEADLVVKAAAYTAVDYAEQEREPARAVNADAPGRLAQGAKGKGIPLIHVSTDDVFDDSSTQPCREDNSAQLGAYGETKLTGERRDGSVRQPSHPEDPLGLQPVPGQFRPHHAAPRRDARRDARRRRPEPRRRRQSACGLRGVFRATASWSMSSADFASRIFAEPSADVVSILTTEYTTPTRRPAFSVLDGAGLRERHGVSLPDGPTSLSACVEHLIATMKTEG